MTIGLHISGRSGDDQRPVMLLTVLDPAIVGMLVAKMTDEG